MRKSALILCSALVTLLVLAVLWVALRRAPSFGASASFAGYVTNGAGVRVATFTVSNTGNTTVRRWDFYRVEGRQSGVLPEAHLGPDAYLAPGQSEVITLPASVTQSVWRATLYFSHDGIRRRINDAAGRSPLARSMLPERFRGLPVDHAVQSDWINQ